MPAEVRQGRNRDHSRYSLSSRVVAPGIAFQQSVAFAEQYLGSTFVGEHGSRNLTRLSGYEVAFVAIVAGKPTGNASTFPGNFIISDGKYRGRPEGVAIDRTEALLVADDVADVRWPVAPVRQPG